MASNPYDEGQRAWLQGKSETANPYPVDSDAHLSWNDGWNDAEAEVNNT